MPVDRVNCGVIGFGGYLGQQLKMYVKHKNYNLTLIPYDRSKHIFVYNKKEINSIDVILNFGTPNEVVARRDQSHAQQSLNEWNEHLKCAVEQAKPSRLLHFSTLHIFGDLKGKINNNHPFCGGNKYGDLHVTALKIVRDLCLKYNISECIIIPSNIYGSIDKDHLGRKNLILNFAIDCAIKGIPLKLASDGKGLRDFLWIEDLLKFLIKIILDHNNKNPLYLVASGTSLTVQKAIKIIHEELGKGRFNDWVTFGRISENSVPFTVSTTCARKYLEQWSPISLKDAAKRIAKIYNVKHLNSKNNE